MLTTNITTPKDRSEYYKQRNAKRTPEYLAWGSMVQRCCNPSNDRYADYGGRGITICDRWRNSPAAFLEDMGPRPSAKHSLEREDNEKGYSKENCVWATSAKQTRNRRCAKMLTVNGVTMNQIDWANKMGVPYTVISMRISRYKWSVEDAVLTPIDVRYRHNIKDDTLRAPKGPMGHRGNTLPNTQI